MSFWERGISRFSAGARDNDPDKAMNSRPEIWIRKTGDQRDGIINIPFPKAGLIDELPVYPAMNGLTD
ncbi:hypothetical protein [Oxalobacter formigenes]|uniref:hypothetical protein n=1 Tax=Oxalobacter formigenes TaxID=847 RepID=UPI0022AF6A62|nr:hypothetical protein [Oxalobacter formigenes]WAW06650.1 hypothetical protein NB639_04355 [Oxalobacter formigenes]